MNRELKSKIKNGHNNITIVVDGKITCNIECLNGIVVSDSRDSEGSIVGMELCMFMDVWTSKNFWMYEIFINGEKWNTLKTNETIIPVLEEKVKVNMKKLSGLLQKCSPQAPIIGVNGYAGEQDGTKVLTTQVLHFSSRKHADEKYPNGVPNYMKTHWAKRTQLKCYDGIEHWKEWVWEVVLYCWSNDPYEGDNNPFEMS